MKKRIKIKSTVQDISASAAIVGSVFILATITGATATATDPVGKNIAIGIDLGTTYSAVSVYVNGKSTMLPNEQGNRITPSYVCFDPVSGERLIGCRHIRPILCLMPND